MTDIDLSYEESLRQQYKKQTGAELQKIAFSETPMPYWVELIFDLMQGAGYSYSHIARRMDASPSTIQRLATNPHRQPRAKILNALMVLHQKVFQGQYVTPRAQAYWADKQEAKRILG